MKRHTIVVALVAAALATACGSKKPTVTEPTDTTPPPAKLDTTKMAVKDTTPTPVSPSLSVTSDLAALCQLKVDQQAASPKFDYDKAELLPADRAVLEQIATCVTTGPGKGKALSLVGRADPRGTEEYNLGLGAKRAKNVSDYLGSLGVPAPQLQETTRGALDASGTDEASYKEDRRVDIALASS
jgi:outer membrane protein OmpA-like peptidoglycan-associated protein